MLFFEEERSGKLHQRIEIGNGESGNWSGLGAKDGKVCGRVCMVDEVVLFFSFLVGVLWMNPLGVVYLGLGAVRCFGQEGV